MSKDHIHICGGTKEALVKWMEKSSRRDTEKSAWYIPVYSGGDLCWMLITFCPLCGEKLSTEEEIQKVHILNMLSDDLVLCGKITRNVESMLVSGNLDVVTCESCREDFLRNKQGLITKLQREIKEQESRWNITREGYR